MSVSIAGFVLVQVEYDRHTGYLYNRIVFSHHTTYSTYVLVTLALVNIRLLEDHMVLSLIEVITPICLE